MSNSPEAEASDPLLASLSHFVDHPDLLAEHTMNAVEWEAVEVLMPRILRGKAKEDVKQLLLAEIDGMSKKRLMAVLAGETLEESSSSEEEEEETEGVSEDIVEEHAEAVGGSGSEEGEAQSEAGPEVIPEDNNDEDREDGQIDEIEENKTMTPPDPGSPKREDPSSEDEEEEKMDTDEEIDRQLEKDLEDFI